ncbi:hypothetical protein [Nodularia sp. NIES-3585]|uniref:hypothetical protein n=1 Tax=Nodularia sp. NIES-3585 TaxID=1973477 RepID=UPI000B5CF41A|nr:hypothetical protein [Nodularia sp. NIES-3585]GAX35506.1 hypothetical protein NIES3585_15210 [Nodularia sp. NIES-3585]
MKNFSLSLYAFHLRHTLTELPGDVVVDANLLWENLVKVGENALPFIGLKDLRTKLICYENSKYEPKREQGRKTEWLTHGGSCLDLGSLPTTDGFKINANLQPFLLNDTYAVDITLVAESANISIEIPQLQHFQPSCLLPFNIQASLGQTLWIYGEVDSSEDCDALAEKLAVALVAGTNFNPVQINQSKLFGSLLFEYQATDHNEPNNPSKQCQILIAINNNKSPTVQLSGKAYDWLRDLLCSYHKIVYIYHQARQRYREARAIYSYLEKTITEFNNLIDKNKSQIDKLPELLAEIPQKSLDYTRCLQDLQIHLTAINTDIKNYEICLDKIKTIGGGNIPEFWQDFLKKDCRKFQEQVQTDINYLLPGKELFGQIVDTIRGIVETQQAESDRSLERTIQILGIGLGGGAIISGIITQYIDQSNNPLAAISPKNPPHPIYASLLFSFIATLLFIVFGWLITKWKYYPRNKK